MQQKVAWGRKNGKSRSFGVFESGGEVLGEENAPLPLF